MGAIEEINDIVTKFFHFIDGETSQFELKCKKYTEDYKNKLKTKRDELKPFLEKLSTEDTEDQEGNDFLEAVASEKQQLRKSNAELMEQNKQLEVQVGELNLKIQVKSEEDRKMRCQFQEKQKSILYMKSLYVQSLNSYLNVNKLANRVYELTYMYGTQQKQDPKYFVKIQCDHGFWSLIEISPPQHNFLEINDLLVKSQDIIGCISSLRQISFPPLYK